MAEQRRLVSDPAMLLPNPKRVEDRKSLKNISSESIEILKKNVATICAKKNIEEFVSSNVIYPVPIIIPPSPHDIEVAKKTAHGKLRMASESVCKEVFCILEEEGECAVHAFLKREFWHVSQIPGLYEAIGNARENARAMRDAERQQQLPVDAEALRREILGGAGAFDANAASRAPRREKAKIRKNDPERQRKVRDEMKGSSGSNPRKCGGQKKGKKGKNEKEGKKGKK